MKTFAIVNPAALRGRSGRRWAAIEGAITRKLGPVDAHVTRAPGSATETTRNALRDGAKRIIAVGGDGTVNEVVNGFFERDTPINPDAGLVVVPNGRGSDFRRMFGIPDDPVSAVDNLDPDRIATIDVGRAHFVGEDGRGQSRYFANAASAGLSGIVARHANRAGLSRYLGARLAYQWAAAKGAMTFSTTLVDLEIDEEVRTDVPLTLIAAMNGAYLGAGMFLAPDARPDDGLFDVVIIRDAGFADIAINLPRLYQGSHVNHPKVEIIRAQRVTVTPRRRAGHCPVELDGEAPGHAPATFELRPAALRLCY